MHLLNLFIDILACPFQFFFYIVNNFGLSTSLTIYLSKGNALMQNFLHKNSVTFYLDSLILASSLY